MEYGDNALSVRHQAALLKINRSSLYYKPVGMSTRDLELMDKIDKIHTDNPCYGRVPIKL